MFRKRVVASVVLAASIAAAPVHLAQKKTVRADVMDGESDAISDNIEINETNFPDAKFRELISAYDKNGNGSLSQDEINAAQSLSLNNAGIKDLRGIKYFTAATYLNCSDNELTGLDVRGMTALDSLYCANNPDLNSLYLQGCEKLKELSCNGDTSLNVLDVSGLTSLVELSFFNSGVMRFDATGCTNLEVYAFDANDPLETLILSGCTKLYNVEIKCKNIQELDVSGCTALETLTYTYGALEKLNVSGCTALTYMYVTDNSLTELDVSECTALKELYCGDNHLTSLDVSNNAELGTLYCYNNYLTSLNVTGLEDLWYLYCYDNCLTYLDMSTCKNLYSFRCELNQLTNLKLNNANLAYLYVYGNKLESVNISSAPNVIDAYQNGIKETQTDTNGILLDYYNGKYGASALAVDPSTTVKTVAPAEVTVTFDANGGSGSMDPITGYENDLITLPECTFTAPDGYEFDSWDEGKPGDGIVISADITIKAVWKAIDYTITVTSDGNGNASASAETAIIGTEITLTATPNEGYQFKEWQVVSGGVTIENDKFTVGTENVEIKAIFEAVPNTTTPEPGPDTPTPDPETPTPEPTTPEPQPGTPTPEPAKDPSFEDFVERLYVVALGRPSEAEGKAYWVEQVVKNGFTGADCARFFMLGAPEFLGRNLTDDEFVEVLYKTYFDRDSEPDGKAYWLGRLASGTERAVLVEEFIESVEWCNVCAMYGVKSGAKYHKATVPSKNAVKFATRLYTCCLGRDPEAEGLEYWSLALTNLDATGYQAASLFFTLPEFVGLKTTNEEYLTRLYTTFMGREPEADGFAYWLGLLNGGTDRNDVMKAFAGCPEFQEICNQYGIERGEI